MSELFTLWRLRLFDQWKQLLGIGFIAAGLAAALWYHPRLNNLFDLQDAERGAYDQGLKTFTWKVAKSKDVVIVAIDDETFQVIRRRGDWAKNLGGWPYYRAVWGWMAEYLLHAGARAIVMDVTIDEPHPDPSGDVAMAQVLTARNAPFYMGVAFHQSGTRLPRVVPTNKPSQQPDRSAPSPKTDLGPESPPDAPPAEESFDDEAAAAAMQESFPEATPAELAQALAFPVVAEDLEVRVLVDELDEERRPQYPVPPISTLVKVVAGFGVVNHEADEDGKIRRTRFVFTDGNNVYPTLSLATVADLFGATQVKVSPGLLEVGSRKFSINADGTAELDFGGDLYRRFDTVPLHEVLEARARLLSGKESQLPADLFRDKIVVVGGFAVGTADVKATPFSSLTPGVVKQAAELQNFVDGRFIIQAPVWASLLLALVVALFSASIILVFKSALLEVAWPLLLFYGFFAITGLVVVHTKVHLLSVMPMLAGELASVASIAANHLFAQRSKERQREMFSRYMEKPLVELMLQSNQLPQLDGERYEMSAFFSDIRGFSTFSETFRDDPKTLVKILNVYLTRVSRVLQKHGGCVDKFIGDAVVCLFGAPLKREDHAVQACRGALAVRDELERIREDFRQRGWPDVYSRIGVNSGQMFVGNIGSDELFDFTAMGDAMNLAARLEGANKNYETTVMIGERTYALAREHIEVRELDRIRVAGKNEPATVYELLALRGALSAEMGALAAQYEAGLALYRGRQFEEALRTFDAILAANPDDGPSKTLRKRCQKLIETPPGADFDGVVSLEK